jgi:hypothetical protein
MTKEDPTNEKVEENEETREREKERERETWSMRGRSEYGQL